NPSFRGVRPRYRTETGASRNLTPPTQQNTFKASAVPNVRGESVYSQARRRRDCAKNGEPHGNSSWQLSGHVARIFATHFLSPAGITASRYDGRHVGRLALIPERNGGCGDGSPDTRPSDRSDGCYWIDPLRCLPG